MSNETKSNRQDEFFNFNELTKAISEHIINRNPDEICYLSMNLKMAELLKETFATKINISNEEIAGIALAGIPVIINNDVSDNTILPLDKWREPLGLRKALGMPPHVEFSRITFDWDGVSNKARERYKEYLGDIKAQSFHWINFTEGL